MSGGYFTTDRARKYGWGVPRLALLTLFAFEVVPRYFLDASGSELNALAAAEAHPGDGTATYPLRLGAYLRSLRWVGHAYMGSIGAGVNVQVLGFAGNLAMLLVAAAFCVADAAKDYSIIVYLAKTFSGDFLAGKLDTAEWKLVLFWTFGGLGPGLWVLAGLGPGATGGVDFRATSGSFAHSAGVAFDWETAAGAFRPYARALPALFLIQTVCEFGDAHLEHHRVVGTFFRHRYGFECFTLAAMTLPKLASPLGGIRPRELRVAQHDLVICLFYRISNLCIIFAKNGWVAEMGAHLERVARKALFRIFAAASRQRLANVTDVDVATAVLKQSSVKGDGLERHVATPAWRPLLSLESVDGDLYESMVRAFHELVAKLPEPKEVANIAEARAREMLETVSRRARAGTDEKNARREATTEAIVTLSSSNASNKHDENASERRSERVDLLRGARVVDAHAVARFSLAVFVEYVFGRAWESKFEVLVDASWAWRREIAVRGRADASVKREAVRLVVGDLLRNDERLWAMHGEAWWEPRNYSLIMQPFLISPAINVGDVAVALKRRPGARLEDAMRDAHPFPIFERFVDEDVYVDRRATRRGATSGRAKRDAGKRRLAVKKNTQVIMFTSDFRGSNVSWPVFGAGPRMCAGTSAALGVLRAVASALSAAGDAFAPEVGHKYSGRHNDGVSSLHEAWYFARTVAPIVLGFGRERQDGAELERRAREALEGKTQ